MTNSFHDYESWGHVDFNRRQICEAYSGTEIVQWYGRIERQLQRMRDEAEKGRNHPAEEKLSGFLRIWRANPITGSINVEDLRPLEAAADVLALDNTAAINSYFGSLRDSLRMLIASEEELPRGMDMEQNAPITAGGGRGGPPMSPDFGPEGEPPPGGEEGEMSPDGKPPAPGGNVPLPPGAEGAGGPDETPGDIEGEEQEPESLKL